MPGPSDPNSLDFDANHASVTSMGFAQQSALRGKNKLFRAQNVTAQSADKASALSIAATRTSSVAAANRHGGSRGLRKVTAAPPPVVSTTPRPTVAQRRATTLGVAGVTEQKTRLR